MANGLARGRSEDGFDSSLLQLRDGCDPGGHAHLPRVLAAGRDPFYDGPGEGSRRAAGFNSQKVLQRIEQSKCL